MALLPTAVDDSNYNRSTGWAFEMNHLRSPASASRSSCESSQASPMSLGSVGSPLNMPEQYVFYTLQNGIDNMLMGELPPFLEITEQPQDKFRFRYKSEMHGTHGCILGVKKTILKKTYPTVELKNFTGEATIRCSLYTVDDNGNNGMRVQHPHILVAKIGCVERNEPHDKFVSSNAGYSVDFQGIGVIHTAKKHVLETLIEKKRKLKLESLGLSPDDKLTVSQENEIREAAARESHKVNLNSVCLRFEAFVSDPLGMRSLCDPVYSTPIHNMKSALTGELKICRIDKVAGSCKGGEDIFIFVEKVNKKNIKVRFFEIGEDGVEIWEDYARFTELDVHHQYAIAFRTPPYRDMHITQSKEVYLELYRPSDGLSSECKKFTYKPQERDAHESGRKRPRTEVDADQIIEILQQPEKMLPFQAYQVVGEHSPMLSIPLPDVEDISGLDQICHTTNSFEQFLGTVNAQKDYVDLLTAQDFAIVQENNADLAAAIVQPNNANLATAIVQPDNADLAADAAPASANMPAARHQPQPSGARNLNMPPTQNSVVLQVLGRVEEATKRVHGADIAHVSLGIISSSHCANDGNNVLHTAVECRQVDVLNKLLATIISKDGRHKMVVNRKNKRDKTPLYLSVLIDEPDMVKSLMAADADPLLECNQVNPLQLAVKQASSQCLVHLLRYVTTEDLSKENPAGLPLLHQAVECGEVKIVKMLVDAGADTSQVDSSYGCTALHIAVQKNNVPMVKYLLTDSRVDVDAVNAACNTCLHIACVVDEVGSPELCQLLLDAGADPWIENNVPLCKADIIDEIDEHLGVKIKTEVLDEPEFDKFRGQTPFHLAINNFQITQLLRSATEKDVTTAMADQVIEPLENMEIKTEALNPNPQLEDALDESTLVEVAQILQESSAWKDLAECMGLEHYVPELETHSDPALRLLTGCMGQVSTSELRELMEAVQQENAVEKIDAMVARQS